MKKYIFFGTILFISILAHNYINIEKPQQLSEERILEIDTYMTRIVIYNSHSPYSQRKDPDETELNLYFDINTTNISDISGVDLYGFLYKYKEKYSAEELSSLYILNTHMNQELNYLKFNSLSYHYKNSYSFSQIEEIEKSLLSISNENSNNTFYQGAISFIEKIKNENYSKLKIIKERIDNKKLLTRYVMSVITEEANFNNTFSPFNKVLDYETIISYYKEQSDFIKSQKHSLNKLITLKKQFQVDNMTFTRNEKCYSHTPTNLIPFLNEDRVYTFTFSKNITNIIDCKLI
jgi:hypothetical protein